MVQGSLKKGLFICITLKLPGTSYLLTLGSQASLFTSCSFRVTLQGEKDLVQKASYSVQLLQPQASHSCEVSLLVSPGWAPR